MEASLAQFLPPYAPAVAGFPHACRPHGNVGPLPVDGRVRAPIADVERGRGVQRGHPGHGVFVNQLFLLLHLEKGETKIPSVNICS